MRIVVLLLWLSVPTLAQIHVKMMFDKAPRGAIVAAIKAQVETLYEGTDIQFHWMEEGNAGPVSSRLLSVHFFGSCSGTGDEPRNDGLPVGWTVKEHGGEVLPFIGLDCDRTRGITGRQPDAIFGRALGYVVGHEIYHALTKNTRHGSGVMKDTFSRRDLLGSRMLFSAQELAILTELRRELAVAGGE